MIHSLSNLVPNHSVQPAFYMNSFTRVNDAALTLRRRILRGGGGKFHPLTALPGKVASNRGDPSSAGNLLLDRVKDLIGPNIVSTSTLSYPWQKEPAPTKKKDLLLLRANH